MPAFRLPLPGTATGAAATGGGVGTHPADAVPRRAAGRSGAAPAHVARLAAALAAAVRGEVRFDAGSRAAYATDASNYRQVPIGVVVPRHPDDAVAAIEVCRRFDVPVFSRGGGTSLAGECCNVAVVLDWSKYANRIESIDPDAGTAVVQPGVVLDDLNRITARHRNLIFGPKPATHDHCTIGGMIGNNSCGSTAQWAGTTAGNVRRMEILTYDGERMWVGPTSDEEYERIQAAGGRAAEIHRAVRALADRYADAIRDRFPDIPRRISGFNLPALLPDNGRNLAAALVGSESTCVTVLRAELDLVAAPAHTVLVLAGYPDVAAAGDRIALVNSLAPHVVEGFDDKLIDYEHRRRMNTGALDLLPAGRGWLMIEMAGDSGQQARERAEELMRVLRDEGGAVEVKTFDDPGQREQIWAVREAALGAAAKVPGLPDAWPGWEDSAVPPERTGAYLRDLQALLDRSGYGATTIYGHFGHGCIHARIPFDLVTAEGITKFRDFAQRAARLVVSYGGSLSGEHGDGQARGELLPIMYGDEIVGAFREFKAIFDPGNRMNPGKVVDAYPLDADLRLGAGYAPPVVDTRFTYPEDGDFAHATTRCVGVGKCRRHTGEGVMCPSYMVTGEEEHSTRGRARLLFEMMKGDVITDGWRSEAVNDALDLCLACKGCKSDCPVNVDMATYKAEFLSHHYAGRLRPRDHYSLGWLPLAARIASYAPGTANALTHAPLVSGLTKRLAGIDPRRDVPRFAAARFTSWFRTRRPRGTGERGPVVLWPDTFTTNLSPTIAAASVGVLEAAGFRVLMPTRAVCCGLTWISTGQLATARRVLRRTLRVLAPYLRAGLPVVGLEPSCTAVFRSDATDLLGPDLDARRLAAQTVTLAELLTERAGDFRPRLAGTGGGPLLAGPEAPVRAIVQTHCHQHAVLGFDAERELMRQVGLDARVLDSGCCGLAGNFGMTAGHREVSLACAERVLLPEVREADPATLVLADGFSCRTQIDGAGTGRRAVHLAEVVNAAIRGTRLGGYPERTLAVRPGDRIRRRQDRTPRHW